MASPLNNPESFSTVLELLESHGGDFLTLVRGDSMFPLIKDGDRLHIRPLQELPQPGDILAFRRLNGLVAHRLLILSNTSEGECFCLAQGDHAILPDPPVPLSLVIGRAVVLHRGESVLSLETPTWRHLGSLVGAIQLVLLRLRAGNRLRRCGRHCITLLIKIVLLAKGL
jgi:hypothetical protein